MFNPRLKLYILIFSLHMVVCGQTTIAEENIFDQKPNAVKTLLIINVDIITFDGEQFPELGKDFVISVPTIVFDGTDLSIKLGLEESSILATEGGLSPRPWTGPTVYPRAGTIFGVSGGSLEFVIESGTPPYSVTSNNPAFQPQPALVQADGDSFSAMVAAHTAPQMITFTVTDSEHRSTTAKLAIAVAHMEEQSPRISRNQALASESENERLDKAKDMVRHPDKNTEISDYNDAESAADNAVAQHLSAVPYDTRKKIVQPKQFQVFDEFVDDGKGRYHFTIRLPQRSGVGVTVLSDEGDVVDRVVIPWQNVAKKNGYWMAYDFDETRPLPVGKYTMTVGDDDSVVFYIGMAAALQDREHGAITRSATTDLSRQRSERPVSEGTDAVSKSTQYNSLTGLQPTKVPIIIPLPRGTAFSTASLTTLPVKHAAGQQPVFEFERFDGRTWRRARSIRPISMQPQPGGGTQVITDASFRITEPGRYRYRVSTDAPGAAFSPYKEFVVTDPKTQIAAVKEMQRGRAMVEPEKSKSASAGHTETRTLTKSGAPTPPKSAVQDGKISEGTAPEASKKTPFTFPTMPKTLQIISPQPNQSFQAPANVALRINHDTKYDVVLEIRKDSGPFKKANPGLLRQLPAGIYTLRVGYQASSERNELSFTVFEKQLDKQAVKAQKNARKQQPQLPIVPKQPALRK
jgi:hypothetical protein